MEEHATIVTWAIVFPSPSLIVEGREVGPQLARRVGHNGVGSFVPSSVSSDVPKVRDQPRVWALRVYVESGDMEKH